MEQEEVNEVAELVSVLKRLDAGIFKNERRTEDVYGLNLLQPLMIGQPFLTFTGAAMRPYCLAHLVNDVLINDRQQILEFGSGVSTILLARLIKMNGLATRIVSIEHDENWLQLVQSKLMQEKLDDVATIIHAPLMECNFSLDGNEWYDAAKIDGILKDRSFDMMIVDGPPAYAVNKQRARYPALPFMAKRLNKKCSLYLDDANRTGEQSVISQWQREYNLRFSMTGSSLAFCYQGEAFFTEPLTSF